MLWSLQMLLKTNAEISFAFNCKLGQKQLNIYSPVIELSVQMKK